MKHEIGGSSPHVRGARDLAELQRAALGIIPACAGSTGTDSPPFYLARDHPRMCGEHLLVSGFWWVR